MLDAARHDHRSWAVRLTGVRRRHVHATDVQGLVCQEGTSLAVVLLVAMSYWIGMLVVLQGLTGRTLGKVVAGIRTVNAEGRPCGLGRAAVRWLFLAVDAFPYVMPMLVGFIVTVASSNRQRVGDLVAGTWVVSRDAAGEPIPTGTAREKAPAHDAPSRSGFYDPPD